MNLFTSFDLTDSLFERLQSCLCAGFIHLLIDLFGNQGERIGTECSNWGLLIIELIKPHAELFHFGLQEFSVFNKPVLLVDECLNLVFVRHVPFHV